MQSIVNEIVSLLERGLSCVCCTIVATRGSTPQSAGAMMLVLPNGNQIGTLGGGCVEAEVRQRALGNLNADPLLHTFLLDDDYGWDDGLICGGRMSVMSEILSAGHLPYYRELKQLLDDGQGFTEYIALPDNRLGWPTGQRAVMNKSNSPMPDLPEEKSTKPLVVDGFALLPVRARIRLLIVGGGHVGQAVARLAADTDFEVWLLDDREMFANAARFPQAARLIVGDIGRELQILKSNITPATYCLIVTRGHNHDEEALYHLATTTAGYIGMIGSKRKVRLILDDLVAKGIPEEALVRVHAPVGIPIGSQTVPEIAVSIVAQLIAHRNR
jgi:xanthine dehydrogenase accessory factor